MPPICVYIPGGAAPDLSGRFLAFQARWTSVSGNTAQSSSAMFELSNDLMVADFSFDDLGGVPYFNIDFDSAADAAAFENSISYLSVGLSDVGRNLKNYDDIVDLVYFDMSQGSRTGNRITWSNSDTGTTDLHGSTVNGDFIYLCCYTSGNAPTTGILGCSVDDSAPTVGDTITFTRTSTGDNPDWNKWTISGTEGTDWSFANSTDEYDDSPQITILTTTSLTVTYTGRWDGTGTGASPWTDTVSGQTITINPAAAASSDWDDYTEETGAFLLNGNTTSNYSVTFNGYTQFRGVTNNGTSLTTVEGDNIGTMPTSAKHGTFQGGHVQYNGTYDYVAIYMPETISGWAQYNDTGWQVYVKEDPQGQVTSSRQTYLGIERSTDSMITGNPTPAVDKDEIGTRPFSNASRTIPSVIIGFDGYTAGDVFNWSAPDRSGQQGTELIRNGLISTSVGGVENRVQLDSNATSMVSGATTSNMDFRDATKNGSWSNDGHTLLWDQGSASTAWQTAAPGNGVFRVYHAGTSIELFSVEVSTPTLWSGTTYKYAWTGAGFTGAPAPSGGYRVDVNFD